MMLQFAIFQFATFLAIFAPVYVWAEPCPFRESENTSELLVGFTAEPRTTTQKVMNELNAVVLGDFRVIASVSENSIQHDDGSSLKNGQHFWSVTAEPQDIELASVGSFLDQMGKNHCVYFGSSKRIQEKFTQEKFTQEKFAQEKSIFTSIKNSLLIPPTFEQSSLFKKLNTTCVLQGDSEIDKKCTRAELLAVSDVNHDRIVEYWATEPYRWDVGITVWEIKDGKLSVLLKTCAGCSD